MEKYKIVTGSSSGILLGVGVVVVYSTLGKGLVVLLGLCMVGSGLTLMILNRTRYIAPRYIVLFVQFALALFILVMTLRAENIHPFNVIWSSGVCVLSIYGFYLLKNVQKN